MNIEIRKANINDLTEIVNFIDNGFTKEGYGFVNRGQIQTEVERSRCFVAVIDNKIVGIRIGITKVYNLIVLKEYRGLGIGTKLIEVLRPTTIRVKCETVGNLSKKQKENFKDPRPFYEKLGFKFWGMSKAKNFFQRGKGGESHYHTEGKEHIHIYKEPSTILWEINETYTTTQESKE